MNAVELIGRSASADAPAEHASKPGCVLDLAHLDGLHASNLQIRWRELFGRAVPGRLGPELMRRAIAYRLQELALGGVSRTAELRLNAAVCYGEKRAGKTGAQGLVIKKGARFVREWKGETHEVLASGKGDFTYRGKNYRSLSVIAREITGAHQSGPRFFGLQTKSAKADVREAADV